MEENRKVMTWLALAGIVVLIMLVSYPVAKGILREHLSREVSLLQEETLEEAEEIENELSTETSAEQTGTIQGSVEALQQENLPEIVLAVEKDGTENTEINVSLWRSEAGTGYFFLPGFAKGESLVLKKAKGGSIRIGNAEVREGDRLVDVSEEKAYEMTYLGENGEALTMPLIFMYSSELPVLRLTTKSGDMETIEAEKGNEEPGTVQLLDQKGTQLYAGRAESIRGRGNSTWGLSKKPYQFKLEEKADLFGFGESKSWNLMANGYDETKLRNRIATQLATELGMGFVPESQMVDLYINDVYYGNYYLTEKIEVSPERVNITDMEEVLNSAYGDQELSKLESIHNPETNRKWTSVTSGDEDITGGYLFERELSERYIGEISGFITSQGDNYALQSPKYASKEQVEYIAGLMQEFQDAVCEPDGIHPQTGKHYSEYIDVNSFVQKYLVEEISKNYDGGVTSSFFYKPQDSVSRKIFAGPVWDYDVAFGNCNLDEIASNPHGITKLSDHVYGTDIFVNLYEKEDFYNAMVTMYEEKALPYLQGLLDGGIDQMVWESRQSAKLDSIRWKSLENRYQYYEEYDNDVRYLKYFIEERMNFLNSVWLEEEAYHNVTFMVNGEAWQIFCIADRETPGGEPIPSRYSSLFMGWLTEDGIPYDRYKPVYEDMVFYATWQELPVEDVVLTGP